MANVKLAFNAAGFWSESETHRQPQQSELFVAQLRDRLREQFDLLVQGVGFDLQFVELREHELLCLIPPRFLLPFADDDVAQDFVFSGQPRSFLGVCAGELRFFELSGGIIQLGTKISDFGLEIPILLLTRSQLLLKLRDLTFYVRRVPVLFSACPR